MGYRKYQRKIKWAPILLGLLIGHLFAGGVHAQDYYVSAGNEGHDSNPGSKDFPFSTLHRGVQALSPGDILYVRQGTYSRISNRWEPPSGLSWEKPVTIKAFNKEKVIIRPKAGATAFEFKDGSHYIIMDGFIIDAKGGHDGLRMGQGGHHMRILNGEVKNAPHQGIQTGTSDYLEFINLKVHNNGIHGPVYPGYRPEGGYSYGFYMPSNHNLIKDCEIFLNNGFGIHGWDSFNLGVNHNTIINNKIYSNWLAGIGIFVGTGNKMINNLIWDNQYGIDVDFKASKSKLYNNTIYANHINEILLGSKSSDSTVINNILVSTSSSPALVIANGSGSSIVENNLIFGNVPDELVKKYDAHATLNQNLIDEKFDPKFKNPLIPDFHLKPESPAINAGQVVNEIKDDFDGIARLRNSKVSFDIGAYQFVGNKIPPPTALRVLSVDGKR